MTETSTTADIEQHILDLLNTLKTSGADGGPALSRLASDALRMLPTAEFPRLEVISVPNPDFYGDDIEGTDYEDAEIDALRCPVCGQEVNPDSLGVVDYAVRVTSADEDAIDFDAETISYEYDSGTDFAGLGYYIHDSGGGHAVHLPEGWTEL